MIICHHYLGHGGALNALKPSDLNFYPAYLIECFSIVAVNGFILIAGYYQIKFKWDKLFNLWAQVFFYSVVISSIFWMAKIEPITAKQLVTTFFPLIFGRWWFITVYVMLYILSPFINLALNNMDKKLHEQLLIVLLIVNVILPSLKYTYFQDDGYSIQNFFFLYCVGDYIRKYEIPKFNYIITYIVSSFILLALISFTKMNIFHVPSSLLRYNFISVEIAAISLFIIFKNIKLQSNTVNKIATSTFGIYLISDHKYIRDVLYTKILHTGDYYYNSSFIPYLIVSVIAIFVCCAIIELIRQKMLTIIQTKIWKTSKSYISALCKFLCFRNVSEFPSIMEPPEKL